MKTSFLELSELRNMMRDFFPEHVIPAYAQYEKGFDNRYLGFDDCRFTTFSVNQDSFFWHVWLKPCRHSSPFFVFNEAETKAAKDKGHEPYIPASMIDVEISDPKDKSKEEWVSLESLMIDDEDLPPNAFKYGDDTCHFRCLLFVNQCS